MMLHLIFTESGVLLSKKVYSTWREIQDEYESYKASLGPWDHEEVQTWLDEEYKNLDPSAECQVSNFIAETDESTSLQFRPIEEPLVQTHTSRTAYRFAMSIALIAACLLIWLSLGVGIIGKDGDPANMMYFVVIAIGIIGTIISRLRPTGMARTLLAMALAQGLIALIALITGLGLPWSGLAEITLLNGFFIVMFVGSAWLFKRAKNVNGIRTILLGNENGRD